MFYVFLLSSSGDKSYVQVQPIDATLIRHLSRHKDRHRV